MSKKLIRTVAGVALMAAAAVGAVTMTQDPGWGSQTQVVRADPGWGLRLATIADPGWGVAPAGDPGWESVRA
ncbi:hypothetical protein [Streptomyces omiyaensis]|uniref:Secreted protein n=1 Tax=Streptomyces omiyaensis TaxID=68247 RepID=A0ABW7C324_9ACTN|nr:hypothetical protein [Streptomyces omiyaensis]GGY43241.1 hypothetical protein GCM10010363_24940 [Streptomyces omiyaensis]